MINVNLGSAAFAASSTSSCVMVLLSSLIPKLERLKSSKKTLAEHLAKINKN